MNKTYIINQQERLNQNAPVSKYGKCPNCDIVEFEVNENGYIICSECKEIHNLTIYHSLN